MQVAFGGGALGGPLPLQPLQPFRRRGLCGGLGAQFLKRESPNGQLPPVVPQSRGQSQPDGPGRNPFAAFRPARVLLGAQAPNFLPSPPAPAAEQRPPIILLCDQGSLLRLNQPTASTAMRWSAVRASTRVLFGHEPQPQLRRHLVFGPHRGPRGLQLAAPAIQVQFVGLEPRADRFQVGATPPSGRRATVLEFATSVRPARSGVAVDRPSRRRSGPASRCALPTPTPGRRELGGTGGSAIATWSARKSAGRSAAAWRSSSRSRALPMRVSSCSSSRRRSAISRPKPVRSAATFRSAAATAFARRERSRTRAAAAASSIVRHSLPRLPIPVEKRPRLREPPPVQFNLAIDLFDPPAVAARSAATCSARRQRSASRASASFRRACQCRRPR